MCARERESRVEASAARWSRSKSAAQAADTQEMVVRKGGATRNGASALRGTEVRCGVSGEILRCSAGERTYGTCSGHGGLEAVVGGSGSRWWRELGVRVQKSSKL